jgi:hypothetical protein
VSRYNVLRRCYNHERPEFFIETRREDHGDPIAELDDVSEVHATVALHAVGNRIML